MMRDKVRGLYDKFRVERTDGKSELGEKHDGCEYFVLDITHDHHAIPALAAYATSARADGYEQLANDITDILNKTNDAVEKDYSLVPIPDMDAEILRLLTSAMRAADESFQQEGGGTRHYIRDCLWPEMQRRRLTLFQHDDHEGLKGR